MVAVLSDEIPAAIGTNVATACEILQKEGVISQFAWLITESYTSKDA